MTTRQQEITHEQVRCKMQEAERRLENGKRQLLCAEESQDVEIARETMRKAKGDYDVWCKVDALLYELHHP